MNADRDENKELAEDATPAGASKASSPADARKMGTGEP